MHEVVGAIFLSKGVVFRPTEPTLIFIDEIQESPEAIGLLRFFHEEVPQLYVIAAGSLLEFSLGKVPSFPVGRINYLSLHPISFDEFLGVYNPQLRRTLHQVPVPDVVHPLLLGAFHTYAMTGGMPEIVSIFSENRNLAVATPIYRELWQAYKDDVEKYARNVTERNIIRHVIDTAPMEGSRIKFEGFGRSNYRSREVGEALRALDKARIMLLIYPSTDTELPLSPNLKKRPRLQFLDTGLLTNSLMIAGEMIGLKDLNDFYRGRIIHQLVYQELISQRNEPGYKPMFWVKEERGLDAEVDLVIQHRQYVIPVEIKSGEKGRLRSLHQFIERAGHPWAVRLYAGLIKTEEAKTPAGKPYKLANLPYYLCSRLDEYIEHFMDQA